MPIAGSGGIASLSNINIVNGQIEPKIQDRDVSPFAELEKQIRGAKIDPSKSIDSVLEEGGKTKKAGKKKLKFKSTLAKITSSPIQTQSILTSHETVVERSIKTVANIKNIVEK